MRNLNHNLRPAQISERIGAFIANIFLGALPVSVPSIVQSQSVELWLKSESTWSVLAFILAVMQYIVVYTMRGSPGYVVAGLRVQLCVQAGSMHKAAIIRASPFLSLLSVLMIMPHLASRPLFMGAAVMALIAILVFLATSGVALVIDGRRSLLDKMSDTEVVKVYSIFPMG